MVKDIALLLLQKESACPGPVQSLTDYLYQKGFWKGSGTLQLYFP
jgi:hypothetical protein